MLALLEEEYGEFVNGKLEQNLTIRGNLQDSAFKELASLYDTDVSNYQGMSDDEKEILMGDLIPAWTGGLQ